MEYNAKEVMQKLNDKMYGSVPDDTIHSFRFECNDYWEAIKFNDFIIWDSENDEREWLEDQDGNDLHKKEDLYIHCVKVMEKYAEDLSKITLNL